MRIPRLEIRVKRMDRIKHGYIKGTTSEKRVGVKLGVYTEMVWSCVGKRWDCIAEIVMEMELKGKKEMVIQMEAKR